MLHAKELVMDKNDPKEGPELEFSSETKTTSLSLRSRKGTFGTRKIVMLDSSFVY